ncbi:MAG: hypothetical protein IPJ13_32225 [Saprospiraceae bacterium]|nr:hypothetical protein [Saprospiraceae bacterium]
MKIIIISPEGTFRALYLKPKTKTLKGLSVVGFGNYSINEHLGVNAKLLYSQMGTDQENLNKVIVYQ